MFPMNLELIKDSALIIHTNSRTCLQAYTKLERPLIAMVIQKYGNKDTIFVGKEGRECFYLTTHSTHLIYGYMASDIW